MLSPLEVRLACSTAYPRDGRCAVFTDGKSYENARVLLPTEEGEDNRSHTFLVAMLGIQSATKMACIDIK